MAVRGINPFEKHIEKILLAVAAAGLAGVVVWQYGPWASKNVKVGTSEVPPDQAYGEIERQAKRLQGQIRETSPTIPAELSQRTNLLDGFKNSLGQAVAPSTSFAWAPGGYELKNIEFKGDLQLGNFVGVPKLPAALKPMTHAFMSTIDANEATGIDGLTAVLDAKAAPFDEAAISVQTSLSAADLASALKADVDGTGELQPMPQTWWQETEILGVELVRQERQRDGSWGAETVVPRQPGRVDYKAQLSDEQLDSDALRQIMADAAARADEVQRPEWFRRAQIGGTEIGEEWRQPAVTPIAADNADEELNRLQSNLKSKLRTKQALEKNIEIEKARPNRSTGGGGGGGGGAGGGIKRGGGAGGGGGGAPQPDSKQKLIEGWQKSIAKLDKDIEQLRAQIAAKGGKAPAVDPNKPVAAAPKLLDTKEPVNIWAHDATVARGSTYRYQVRVHINNPLFNKGAQLRPSDADAGKRATLTIAAADWSDPVTVDDQLYYFITNAVGSEGKGILGGVGSAKAELFHYTWGFWRRAEVSLEPGDPVAGTIAVPDASKIAAVTPAAPAQPNQPVPPGGGGGGRKGISTGEGRDAPPPPATPKPASGPVVAMIEIPVERDAYLLDVPMNPVGSTSTKLQFFALIRDTGGTIVQRVPEAERANPTYKRLVASVESWKRFVESLGTSSTPGTSPGPGATPPVPPSAPPIAPGGGG